MIKDCAAAGVDVVKLQLYDATTLREDDPQKAWLAKAQVSREMLEAMRAVAQQWSIELTASVFGIPQAQMAKDAGLTTIKVGSGDAPRKDLLAACYVAFDQVWVSEGLAESSLLYGVPLPQETHYQKTFNLEAQFVRFYGVSQYPTLYIRGLARLTQANKTRDRWGWSCHGDNLEVCKEAILHGATYVERHFNIHDGPREFAEWDTDVDGFRELRAFAETAAWENSPEHEAACKKYLNRWTGDQ